MKKRIKNAKRLITVPHTQDIYRIVGQSEKR